MEAGDQTTILVGPANESGEIVVTVQGGLTQDQAVEVIGAVFDSGAAGTDIASITAFQGALMARLSRAPDLPTVAGEEGYDPHKDRSAPAAEEGEQNGEVG